MDGDDLVIRGNKGGPSHHRDSLRSNARARLIELISEGPIVGLVDGAKSIYFNQTPVQNEDDTFNFDDVQWQERKGLPDQTHLNGNNGIEQVTSVEVEVKVSSGPTVRTIIQPDADAIRVIIRLQSLFNQDRKGNMRANHLTYGIDVRPVGGTWVRAITKVLTSQKTTSPTQFAHRIPLPESETGWDVRVVRETPDSTVDTNQSTFFWESYVTIVEGRFIHPHSALVGIEVNAEDLGTSLPQRAFKVKGLIISVPINYDPETRVYTGIWNGTFKEAWTNNPAWIFYDLITNDRYGLGEFVTMSEADKWGLYQIAQYCDGLVPSGFKDEFGDPIMEPRYTFNAVISNREDAYFALQNLTTAWRGMGYWAIGQYFATADMPADPVRLVTPANVLGGRFSYSSTAMKARHTVAMVKWNDPQDFFRPATELVIDEAGLQKNGWREKRLDLLGCTSRGLAHRYGRWVLDIENNETETVEYSASFDHMDMRPGALVAIADPRKAEVRHGGRVVSHVGTLLTMDADVELSGGETYQIYLTKADGNIELLDVISRPAAGQLILEAASEQAEPGSVFVISSTNVRPRLFRVLSIKESAENVFSISALFHDPTKYARVEENLVLEPIAYRKERVPSPPTNLTAVNETYIQEGSLKLRVVLSWTPPPGMMARTYTVVQENDLASINPLMITADTSADITNLAPGEYVFKISSTDREGRNSSPASIAVTVDGAAGLDNLYVSTVDNRDDPGSTEFEGSSPQITWVNAFPVSINSVDPIDTVSASPLYESNIVSVYDADTDTLLRTAVVVGSSYRYAIEFNRLDSALMAFSGPRRSLRFDVQAKDINGNISPPVSITLTNPTPAAITPTIQINASAAYISWPRVTDEDFRGVRAWIDPVSTFDPLVTIPVYDGSGGSFSYNGSANTIAYLKIAAYDAFSKDGMIISGPFTIDYGSIADYAADIEDSIATIIAGQVEEATGAIVLDYENRFDILHAAVDVFVDTTDTTATILSGRITTEETIRIGEVGVLSSRIDTVEATADDLEAAAVIQAAALATLQGNASASIVMRTKAGTAGAELELVAADGPSGTVSAARISATDIILDGTVTANKLNTTSLQTSGTAIFGGLLKSSGYVAGITGWRISNDGTAEFKNLVERDWIKENAVTDKIQSVVLGPVTKVAIPTGAVVATLDVGPIGNGEGWERRVHFEARLAGSPSFQLMLERRGAQLGAGFEPWGEVSTYDITNDTVWMTYGSSGNIAQPYDDYEYRLRASIGFASGTATVLRNVYMTAVRITK